MEAVEARALKSSFHGELTFMKTTTQQTMYEDCLSLNANNGVSGEDFSVDDLLDFSNGEFQHGSVGVKDEFEEEEEEKDSLSLSSPDHVENDSNSNSISFSGSGDADSIFVSELAVPADDLADLEWVSHFVDDSLPELSLLYPTNSWQTKPLVKKRSEPEARPDGEKTPCFPSRVPVKARTKRSKPNGRVWSFGSSTSESSSPSSCSSGFYSTPCLITLQNMEFLQSVTKPPVKKQKKKSSEARTSGGSQFQRRCSHCGVQKTPQWRAGPLGTKTLCNACGVRYKSGRLFPEYRPACSPTFSGEIHSNSHRKVLEMRKRKDMDGQETGFTYTQMVPSY
ncbi:GATA transcription factor [Quillaja saponaria]|uniref:GATA transcription factor n=1 Tax=Quillaja saponaria TaxID=32244 RepID=A0AAD7QBM2_QUISA|nr:GATA transcription factor [Quillaja saponaria]